MPRVYHHQGGNMAVRAHTMGSIGRVLIGLAVLWGMIGLSGGGSWALDSERTRATLRGVQRVEVVVERLEPDVERAGLTQQQLQIDVELQLRKAGIRVLTQREALAVPGQPYLYINANVVPRSGELTAYSISVELEQLASLETNGSLAIASTWSAGSTGSVGSERLDFIRGRIKDRVDEFINAYLSVHPRPASSAAPASTSPRRDLVRQVQERLQAVGFNPGTIDGAIGPQTQQALRWFQNAQGLRATGDLDEPTLNALGVR
jgi:hypothetical protein